MKAGMWLALALSLSSCSSPRPSSGSSATPQPTSRAGLSVLLITIDTLRADHLGAYGYSRHTSPNIDALAKEGTLFEAAYTFWPKTRGSFVMIHTGRRPSQNGYSRKHPVLLGFNPTIAGVLKKAGYQTVAAVDNPNVAAQYGYAEGFERYRETWEEKALVNEMDRARAITADGAHFLESARPETPFFLWLHYVNPHAPYTPPPPYDTAFLDAESRAGDRLPVVPNFHGGIPKQWAVPGHDRRGYYVAQYDGEIAAVDHEVGEVISALRRSKVANRTLVIVTSDHGESLGEHGYYFDHGENVFDPCLRIPLLIVEPGATSARTHTLASTLDLMPTILDAAKVSYPPDLAGTSLLPVVEGRAMAAVQRLEAQNDRDLAASFDRRFKTVRTPTETGARFALYDRKEDTGELHDAGAVRAEELRVGRREMELFLERADREWVRTRALIQGRPSEVEGKMTAQACEQMRALGYVAQCAP